MFRCLLISLLILTLPLKGLAAAGYMACGPAHASAAVAQPHSASGASVDHRHAGATMSHAGAHAATDATSVDAEDGSSQADPPAGTKCVQCAPCCGAVAPQAEAPVLATDVNAETVVQEFCSLRLGGGHDRIDRPPRSLP